ncbi:MAG: hypothetical protein NXH75_12905, partial [Halobacteriovoraceae bacterium]|nr:hypothetical protein [Halobacteriovoraceae bacterium]
MNKWLKIEEMINQLILKLTSLFNSKVQNVTPKKIKNSLQNGKELLTSRRGELKQKISKGKDKAFEKALVAKDKVDKAKDKTLVVVQKAKETNYKEIKMAKVLAVIFAFISPPLIKLKGWYLKLRPGQIASFVSVSTIATLASVNIYVQSNKISEKAR